MSTFPPTKLRYAPPPINRPLELLQTLRGTGVKPFVSPDGSRLCLWEEPRQKTTGKVEFSPLAVKVIYVLHVVDGVEIRVGVKWLREQRVFGVGSRRGGSKDRGAMMLEEDALTISINLIFRNRSVRYITDAGHPGEPQAEQSRGFENLFLCRLRLNCILEGLSRRIFFSMTLSGWSLQEFDCS